MYQDRYRGMGRDQLDVAYNNRAVVLDWQDYLDKWTDWGQQTYKGASVRDLQYGELPRQRMDVFLSPDRNAATCLFLHGGYWQWNDKEGQACAADGIQKIGLGAAIGEYSLAPHATMAEICQEALAQVEFLSAELRKRGRSDRIIVCGISTGAQLMACTLGLDCVVGALLMSGIYDLEPIRVSSLNEAIGMQWSDARQWSPLHNIPASVPPTIVAFGADERPEIRRQSADYHANLLAAGHPAKLLAVQGAHHFSILETLIDGNGAIATALKGLASEAGARTATHFS